MKLRKQPPMRRVILASLPCVAGAVYFFGWRALAVVLLSCVVGLVAEWLFCRRRGEPVSEAVFVTAFLFALVMPPTVPWHVVIIGMLFAVAVTKMLFGGFGRNIFNPALAGRCFVYVCFPVALTGIWAPPAQGPWGALGQWKTWSRTAKPDEPDALTSATPMAKAKAAALEVQRLERNAVPAPSPVEFAERNPKLAAAYHDQLAVTPAVSDLLLGRVSGTMGVTSALLIVIGGLYLFITKTANRAIILSVVLTYAALTAVLYALGVAPVPHPLRALLGGGFLFGAFFMATDPVSAPRTPPGRVIYGVLIAVCTLVIRNFSIFNGGLMFSILIGNMFAPIVDYAVTQRRRRKAG